MAEPISVQQLKNASLDAISLAEFIYKPASAMVKRRLAPDMHTLDFYTNLMENLYIGKVSAEAVSTSDGSTQAVKNTEFRDELDALPFKEGVLADTFVMMTKKGSGAIARTLRDINSETLSLKDFGAVGDGITDDTAAVLALSAYVNDRGGYANIIVPPTDAFYSVTTGFKFDQVKNVKLSGSGATIKVPDGTPDVSHSSAAYSKNHLVWFIESENIVISDLVIDGNIENRIANLPAESFNSAVEIEGCRGVMIRGNTILGGMTDNIGIRALIRDPIRPPSYNVTIINNTIKGARRNNISALEVEGCYIIGNHISYAGYSQGTNPMAGIDIEPNAADRVKDVLISGNTIEHNKGKFQVSAGGDDLQRALIEGNTIRNGIIGINHNPAADQTSPSGNIVIRGNTMYDLQTAIRAVGVGVSHISDNTVYNCSTGVLSFRPDGLEVVGNLFKNMETYGIVSGNNLDTNLGVVDIRVQNNRFVDCKSHGAKFFVADENASVLLVGNHFVGTLEVPEMAASLVDKPCLSIADSNSSSNLIDNAAPIRGFAINNSCYSEGASERHKVSYNNISLVRDLNIRGLNIQVAEQAPLTGTYFRGDFVLNQLPTSKNQPLGWRCIAAGSPGTWSAVGEIEPLIRSIESTPPRTGVIAVVSGKAYISVGSSSPADWKQITNNAVQE